MSNVNGLMELHIMLRSDLHPLNIYVKLGRGSIWIYISFLRVHACVHSLFLCFCVICTIWDANANLSLLLTRLSDFRSVLMFQFGQLYERKTVIDCPKQLQKREGVSLQILFTQELISDLTLPECTLDRLQLCFAKNYSHAETLQKTQRISNKCYLDEILCRWNHGEYVILF